MAATDDERRQGPLTVAEIAAGLDALLGVDVVGAAPLVGGLDRRAWTYRVDCTDRAPIALRVTRDDPRPATYLVPRQLRDQGIEPVVAPIPMVGGELIARRGGLGWSAYPFVDGVDGWGGRLTERHWTELGAALHAIHHVPITAWMQDIRRDAFDVSGYVDGADAVDMGARTDAGDVIPEAFVQSWQRYRPTLTAILEQMQSLADDLRERPRRNVVCHGDLHPGNVLVGTEAIHIIDWDEVLLAPPERDFLFVPDASPEPAAAERPPSEPTLSAAFRRGYPLNDSDIDWIALTYYRCERVAQDAIAFADDALGPKHPDDVRSAAAGWIEHVFGPGGEAEAAIATAGRLPAGRDILTNRGDLSGT